MDKNNEHIVRHDDTPSIGDEVGEAAGGIGGVLAGAAIGSLGGPIGTIIGGIAGAAGGWWAGRAVSEAAKHYTSADDAFYRNEYERSPDRLADRSYEQVRPAYQLGHLAGRNPEYAGKSFEIVEVDLARGWNNGAGTVNGDWDKMKGYARNAYNRSASAAQNATDATRAELDTRESTTPDRADDVYSRVDPNRKPLSPEGPDATRDGVRY